jgi:hypothetical protein
MCAAPFGRYKLSGAHLSFGSFTPGEHLLLQRLAHTQGENAALVSLLEQKQNSHATALVQREKELQAEKDAFVRSVSETCNAFRLRALTAEEHAAGLEAAAAASASAAAAPSQPAEDGVAAAAEPGPSRRPRASTPCTCRCSTPG